MITVVVGIIMIIHPICSGSLDHDSSIYTSFLLLLSRQAKRIAFYKNAQSLKYIVFEYILIITKGYEVQATTIGGPNAEKVSLDRWLKTHVMRLRGVTGRNALDQIVFCAFHTFWAIPHLFERLFLISWENNRDCHITMPLSLKTLEVQIKGDQ